jgi:phosphoribosylaminoimidazole-succinocarboxamide synthase
MTQKKPLYEGKAKVIFDGPEAGTLVQYFKDDATAFNAQKKEVINGKGVLNNYISEHIMLAVGELGIPNHFISRAVDSRA